MTKEQLEALKEVGRWVGIYSVSFVISWFITETLAQITNVPEFITLNIWVFAYMIPVRQLITFGLTLLGRFIDKYLHEMGKTLGDDKLKAGLTRF